MVFGPGRPDFTAHSCDAARELACVFSEGPFRLLIEISHTNRGDGNLQFFAGSDDGLTEKFPFRGVNQWVRGKDFFERGQRAT